MKTKALRAGVLLLTCLFMALSASAQTEFQLTLKAMAYQTNAAGKIVTSRIINKNVLQQAAQSAGLTNFNLKNLALVYHLQGSTFGDTIDVVSTTNGAVVSTPFGLFFGQDATLGRTALTNGQNTEVIQIDYVYTPQNTHSMGAAFVTKKLPTRAHAIPSYSGPIEWLFIGNGSNTITTVNQGSFTTGKALF